MTTPDWIIVGRIRKAHGIRGDVVVEPITDEPDAIFAAGRRLFAADHEGEPLPGVPPLTVERAQDFKGGLIVHLDAIGDRTAADLWRDRYLLVPAEEVAPPGEGEIFYHELPGMRVELEGGVAVGDVVEFYELPQGLMLEVDRPAGRVVLPFRDEFVVSVDRAARRIVMTLPDGLLD